MSGRKDTINVESRRFPDEYLERLNMEPIARYKKYSTAFSTLGIFPWNLLIHFLLVISTSFQVIMLSTGVIDHARGDVYYLYHWFILKPVHSLYL